MNSKKLLSYLPVLLLPVLLASCDIPAQKDFYRASYATVCSYSVNNYHEGDRIVFECSEGYLDTLEVYQVTKRFMENKLSGDSGSDSPNRYAEVFVHFYPLSESKKAMSVSLVLYLYHDEENELEGEVVYYDYINSKASSGCMFRKPTIPSEKIWRTDCVGELTAEETFAEVKKDVGLYSFRNNLGTVWSYKKKLK